MIVTIPNAWTVIGLSVLCWASAIGWFQIGQAAVAAMGGAL